MPGLPSQLVANLLTYHNLYYLKKLMWSLRQSIIEVWCGGEFGHCGSALTLTRHIPSG